MPTESTLLPGGQPPAPAAAPAPPPPAQKSPLGLKIIAGAKIIKGVLLFCLSIGVFDLIHRDLAALALHIVQVARISPENHYVELMLEKLGVIEPATLRRLGELSALYASIQLVEGLGLWFGAAWAEYVVVISSGIFIPEECIALVKHFTWVRLTVLLVNAAILAYVAYIVWHRHLERKAARAAKQAAGPVPA
jgi:uncharacterized membrane protein (DUF2068 family)